MRPAMSLGALALLVAGCATPVTPPAPSAAAELRSAGAEVLARASATQAAGGARIFVEAAGLQPGTYGVHVHATGQCQGPDFGSAGGHWNPTGRRHGVQNPQGPHHGDLPNLIVGANGRGTIAYVIPGAQLAGGAAPVLDADGAAVVVHAQADDYRTDPAGNSGARIACGVLR